MGVCNTVSHSYINANTIQFISNIVYHISIDLNTENLSLMTIGLSTSVDLLFLEPRQLFVTFIFAVYIHFCYFPPLSKYEFHNKCFYSFCDRQKIASRLDILMLSLPCFSIFSSILMG